MSAHPPVNVDIAHQVVGNGPEIVLVHGFTGSSLDWTDVVEPLSRTRRVVTFDHRGHGKSTNTGDPSSYTFEALERDLAALVDRLELGRFDLLGHSMGGVVAMQYALHHRGRVRSLVLMDTAAGAQAGARELLGPGIELVRTHGTGALYGLVAPFLGEGARADELRARLQTKLDQMDPVAFVALGEELTRYPSLLDGLAQLDVPTTVIVGERDLALRRAADELAATVSGAQLVEITAAGHSPQEDDPAAWCAAVEHHLARAG